MGDNNNNNNNNNTNVIYLNTKIIDTETIYWGIHASQIDGIDGSFNLISDNIEISSNLTKYPYGTVEINKLKISNDLHINKLNSYNNTDKDLDLTDFTSIIYNTSNNSSSNLNNLIEISNNNITDISEILVFNNSVKDCSNIIYINSNNNNTKNILVNVNLNYRCSYSYKERIKILLYKYDYNTSVDKKLLESTYLGTEMGTNYTGNYSCSYLDNNIVTSGLTKYYIKFRLESNINSIGQGIIDISNSASISLINFNI